MSNTAVKAELRPERQGPHWSDPVFKAGLVVGGALLAVGLVALVTLAIPITIAYLIICCGLGIILGAFGSLAVIRYKGFVISGVAAVAIALLLLVDHLGLHVVKIQLNGDLGESSFVLVGDYEYPGARNRSSVEFYILAREISRSLFDLIVETPERDPQTGRVTTTEIIFECIPTSSIRPYLGSGRTLEWRFDQSTRSLSGVIGTPISDGPCSAAPGTELEVAARAAFSLVGTAHAQEAVPDVDELLADLTSDVAVVRRDARKQLAQQATEAAPKLFEFWSQNPDDYRVRLGSSVALAESLRDNKQLRTEFSEQLTADDLGLVLAATGDPDRTVRVYATEFLYDLGDTRLTEAVKSTFDTASPDGQYNAIFVLTGAAPYLTEAQAEDLKSSLGQWAADPSVGPATKALISDLSATLE